MASYVSLFHSGKLGEIIKKVEKIYDSCTACPHQCKVNRFKNEAGFCNTNQFPFISSYNAHFGEEPPLVGSHGSGTIFFSNCNLKCKFCQNCEISQEGYGRYISFSDLAKIMLDLQENGCHNINFVSPSHQILAILKALEIACEKGLKVPLVYNSGGYDSLKILRLLEGVFDIYMPDIKYFDNGIAFMFSGIKQYKEVVKDAVIEMYRQTSDLVIDSTGIAEKGLLVRHLVLPNKLADSKAIIDFLVSLSENIYVNIMDQYRPEFKAHNIPEINRRITRDEYLEVVEYAKSCGLKRLAE